MSNEQNIYDIVRLLKETVDSPITDESVEENIYGAEEQVSADELHETLKLKFSAENFEAEPEEKSPYDLDSDFLEEFSEIEEEEPVEETAKPEEEPVEEAEEILVEENNEYIEQTEVSDTEPEMDISEDIPEPEEEEQLALEAEDEAVEHFEVDTEDYSDEAEELEEAPLTVEEIFEEEIKEIEKIAEEAVEAEEAIEAEETVEPEEAPIQKNMSFKSLIMDYGKPDPTPGDENEEETEEPELEDDTPDVGSILSDFATPAKDDVSEENRAAREFMSKLGCEDELDDIPADIREILGETHSKRINTMVSSLIKASTDKNDICMESDVQDAANRLRSFLFENVYLNPVAKSEESKAKELLARLYDYYVRHPEKLAGIYRKELENESVEQCVCDFVSGMTDRYAIETYRRLFIPEVWRGAN